MKRAAAMRLAHEEALAKYPKRSPGEALLDAFHSTDAQAMAAAAEGSAEARALQAQATQLASTLIAKFGPDYESRLTALETGQVAELLLRLLADLEVTAEQRRRVPGMVRRQLPRLKGAPSSVERAVSGLLHGVEAQLSREQAARVGQAFTRVTRDLLGDQSAGLAQAFLEELRSIEEQEGRS